jgi:hypothetical protein
MSLLDVKRKIGELKLDLQTMLDQRFTDESDELALAGLIDRNLKVLGDLLLETDLLEERLNFLEAEVRASGKKTKARKPAKKAKKKAKPKKKAKKPVKRKAKPKKKAKKKTVKRKRKR